MLITGVDPGLNGALATLDATTRRIVDMRDMPTWFQIVGRKKRQRVDAVELCDYIEYLKMLGVRMIVLESVGGRPQQSAPAAFTFGYTVGLLYMACMTNRLPIETVVPNVWKKALRLPGKKEPGWEGSIIERADQLFPDSSALFRGPRGGYAIDRAEAGLLAKYGADYLAPTASPVDIELKEIYRRADTGA